MGCGVLGCANDRYETDLDREFDKFQTWGKERDDDDRTRVDIKSRKTSKSKKSKKSKEKKDKKKKKKSKSKSKKSRKSSRSSVF